MIIELSLMNKEQREQVIAKAAEQIRNGEVVAFPTETVYGLGANGLDVSAVRKVFAIKRRPLDNPVILHVSEPDAVKDICRDIPLEAWDLMERFWPGPLTLLLPKKDVVPDEVTAGSSLVAVRCPDSEVARALIREAKVPIAAPSANRSGRPSPTRAMHVNEDLGDEVTMILDDGPTGIGLESTVLDLSMSPPMILRPGGLSREDLEQVLGVVNLAPGLIDMEAAPPAPGMKYTHYAPEAHLVLYEDLYPFEAMRNRITEEHEKGNSVGVLCFADQAEFFSIADIVLTYKDLIELAQNLFANLRIFDEKKVDVILVAGVSESDIGLAIMNRLRKAASELR